MIRTLNSDPARKALYTSTFSIRVDVRQMSPKNTKRLEIRGFLRDIFGNVPQKMLFEDGYLNFWTFQLSKTTRTSFELTELEEMKINRKKVSKHFLGSNISLTFSCLRSGSIPSEITLA